MGLQVIPASEPMQADTSPPEYLKFSRKIGFLGRYKAAELNALSPSFSNLGRGTDSLGVM